MAKNAIGYALSYCASAIVSLGAILDGIEDLKRIDDVLKPRRGRLDIDLEIAMAPVLSHGRACHHNGRRADGEA
jgi:hypothetical protein